MKFIISIFILLFCITTTVFSDDGEDFEDYYVQIDEYDASGNLVNTTYVPYSSLLASEGDSAGEFQVVEVHCERKR